MSAPGDRRIVVLLHAGFVVAGMATTLLGPMMPLLMTRWSLSDASAGVLFTAQFSGQTLSTIGSTWLTARLGDRPTLALGMAMTSAGIAVMALVPWPYGAAAAFGYGLGLGLVLPLTNFIVAALRPARAAASLSLLNVSWGVGAVLWPLVVRLSMAAVPSAAAPLAALTVMTAALAAVLYAERQAWPVRSGAKAAPPARPAGGVPPASVAAAVTSPGASPVTLPDPDGSPATAATPHSGPAVGWLVAGFAAASYLYVGAEASVGGWIAEFTRRTGPLLGTAWTLAPTAFWGAETLGRLAAPLVLRRTSEARLLSAGLLLAAVAVILLVTAGDVGAAMTGAALAGAGLAPIFPLILAAMNRHVAPVAPHLMGPLFAMGGLGGATLPWVVGLTSTRTGSLQSGLVVPLVALAGIMALHAAASRRLRA